MRRAPPPAAVDGLPITFQVGERAVVVQLRQRRWVVAVDAEALPGTYATQAEAWEAGVRHAARLDAARQ